MSDHNAHLYPARAARIAAGFTVEQVAKRLRITPRYLSALERGQYQGFAFHIASRLRYLYDCRIEVFLPPKKTGGVRPGKPAGRKGCCGRRAPGKIKQTQD